MPSVLFVHENFPAQFGDLAQSLARRGWNVVFATARGNFATDRPTRVGNVDVVRYARAREPSDVHPYLVGTERAVLNGQGFARTGAMLAQQGFTPDIVVAHSGWGSGSFARIVWPDVKLVQYLEWWYNFPHADALPGDETATTQSTYARTLVRNLPFLLDFQQADIVLSPTRFQADQAPDFVRSNTVVQHDGVDCTRFRPLRPGEAPLPLEGVPDAAPIVTFATRGMEPMRGFPTFMAAAALVQACHPDAHIVVAGADRVHYGAATQPGQSHKAKALAENAFDPARLHFTGLLPKSEYARLLRRSQAHVYLTRPFVLSWSLIEAMASGCPLVVSDTAPVREVMPEFGAGLFVPLDDAEAVARAVSRHLSAPQRAQAMGQGARSHVMDRYAADRCHAALERRFLSVLDAPAMRGVA